MATLLAAQRHAQILELLRINGAVRVSDLSQTLAVSEMTIRRDIEELAARGLCRRIHGGASKVSGSAQEPGFEAKSLAHGPAKRAIARAAAALVEPGQSVAISAGTTTVWIAAELGPRAATEHLTIVTNSLPAAEMLARADAADQTILTGGVRTPSQALVGPVAEATIRQMHFDWFFLGVHGMDLEGGLTTPNIAEAATNQAFIAAATELTVVADSSKWGVVAFARIAPLAAATRIVTNPGLPPTLVDELGRLVQLTQVTE
ncbi:MAG: DeoR/GlpR family DNA-binding transcription regulator [Bifidobacteriaceae bacterium]|jgi:DeoR/GlpR family transcriptional regulator of sugar metabolism|nr:DeoR/GlpR family DNA-binding transcription regulator [Bifidobacteriaceae bacterium]